MCVLNIKVSMRYVSDLVCVPVAIFADVEPGTHAEQIFWIDANRSTSIDDLEYHGHTSAMGVKHWRPYSPSGPRFGGINRRLNIGLMDDVVLCPSLSNRFVCRRI